MNAGEAWSLMSIWVDQNISAPLSYPLGVLILGGFACAWVYGMYLFGKSGYKYFNGRKN